MERIQLLRNGNILIKGMNEEEKGCIKRSLGSRVKIKNHKDHFGNNARIVAGKNENPSNIALELEECFELKAVIPESISMEGCFAPLPFKV